MANSYSAKKRIKQNERDHVRNRARKSVIKTETRKLLDLIQQGDLAAAQEAFAKVQKKLDQVAAKRTLHPNTVARRKSGLARQLNAAIQTAKAG